MYCIINAIVNFD